MKKLYLLLIMIFCSLGILHSYDKEFRLPSLTPNQQEAGVRESKKFYAPGLDYDLLHKQGNTIDKSFLENFFWKTIFQFYTTKFTGYDFTYNYLMFENKSLKIKNYDYSKFADLAKQFKFKAPIDEDDIYELIPLVKKIKTAIESFKDNELLKKLGIAYQRRKIVVEKINKLLTDKKESGATQEELESISKILYEQDRLATDLQTMIFYMMKEAYEKYIQDFSEKEHELKDFVPDFIKAPYYKEIKSKLDELTSPVNSINGFSL